MFPAGILQPPFFDPNADDAVNYGEIGATIGHEISHGFDDQGSKYDGDGALAELVDAETDRKNFNARTDALAAQYDKYEPLPGMHINGKLTMGENIADLAGLVIAYKAYHIALGGKPAPVLNGYTGDQRFYIAYAQSWREKHRDGRIARAAAFQPAQPIRIPRERRGAQRRWLVCRISGHQARRQILPAAGTTRASVVRIIPSQA